jgi:hypothetical protein
MVSRGADLSRMAGTAIQRAEWKDGAGGIPRHRDRAPAWIRSSTETQGQALFNCAYHPNR